MVYGVEGLGSASEGIALDEHAGGDLVLHNDRPQHGEADVLARQETHHRHVVDLSDDSGAHPEAVDEGVEPGPDARPLEQSCQCADEADGPLGQAVRDVLYERIARGVAG